MKKIIRHVNVVPNGLESFYGAVVLDEEGKIFKVFKGDFCFCHEQVEMIEGHDGYLIPGMIDIHLHGALGLDFNVEPTKAVKEISAFLPKEGTTSFLTSLTVESQEKTLEILKELASANTVENGASFEGIHMEGPYLSVEKKALMNEKYIRNASAGEFHNMQAAASNKIKTMTIAPENEGTQQFVQACNKEVALMIGHTNCTSQQALSALKNGAKGFTHFYNAMSQHEHRNPGAVTAGLISDEAYCELIVDGHHVDPDVVKATYKAIGPKRIILVTDAMLGRGMADGEYTFSNLKCIKTGSEVHVKKNGIFAGSVISQLDAIKNMKKFTGCKVEELVQMACVNPADLLHLNKGVIAPGRSADLLLLDKQLNLMQTYINGGCVYDAAEVEKD